MLSFARIIPTIGSPSPSINNHITTCYQFIIETLCRAADKLTLFRWIRILQHIFKLYPLTAKNFIRYLLTPLPRNSSRKITHPHYSTPFDSDENFMKQLILECPHEPTRVAFVDLFTAALIQVVSLEVPQNNNIGNWGLVKDVIDNVEDLDDVCLSCQFVNSWLTMVDTSRFVWKKFKQYWEILRY